ncbi:MAG TPA: hypothetical protein VIY48_12590 [Candidatus Paceibacterota bacterium]
MGFSDYEYALEVRDIVQKMISLEVDKIRPRYQMAVVVSIDRPNRKCEVQFPGDTGTVVVNMGSIQPSAAGQVVRIAGLSQDRYVDDVIGVPYIEGQVNDLANQVSTKIQTFYSPSTSIPTATAIGDLWAITDIGALFRWNGTEWIDTGLASMVVVRSRGTDLITNGTGQLLNNTNFPDLEFVTDAPSGASGSFRTPTTAATTAIITDRVPFNPNTKYRFSFMARQTTAGISSQMYGFIVPRDSLGNIILPKNYMYRTGTMTTLAAQLNPGATTITLTANGANWYRGANANQRVIQFWNYVDSLGKTWGSGSYTRNVSADGAWNQNAISGNVITLAAPWAGATYPAGTAVSNGTTGNQYIYMTVASNVTVPETWTNYAETFSAGIFPSASQQVADTGAAGWTTGLPSATAQVSFGWLLNQGVATGKHAIGLVSVSEAAAASALASGYATDIATLQSQYTGLQGTVDGKATIWYQNTQPTLTAADQGDIWINTSTTDRVTKVWSGTAWQDITDAATLSALSQVQGKITTFYVNDPPTATATGDLWVDLNDNNRLYRWNGSIWQDVADLRTAANATAISTLQSDLTGVQGQVDGKSVIWYQTTAPSGLTSADQGDIWIDSSTTDRISKVWNGTAWVDITDTATLSALSQVSGKITTFYQNDPPSATADGDLWIDTNDGRKLYRWAGKYGLTTRVNLITNPSFENGTVNVSASNVTLSRPTSWKAYRNYSLGLTPNSSGNDSFASIGGDSGALRLGMVANGTYTLSGWVYTPIAQTGTLHARARKLVVIHRIGAGAYNEFATSAGTNAPVTGGERVSVTFTLPAGTTEAFVRLYNGAGNTATNLVQWDGILLETGSSLNPYFDGDSALFPNCAWNGAAWESASTYTPAWSEVTDQRVIDNAATLVTIQSDLTGLSGRVDGKSTVYVQPTQPHDSNLASDVGDVWIDTANGRIIKTYNGSDWIVSDDTRLALALSTANSKITTYYTGSAPSSGMVDGDLWVETWTNRIYQYRTGTGWVPLTVMGGAISPEITGMLGQKLYDTMADLAAWTKDSGSGSYSFTSSSAAETGGFLCSVAGPVTMIRNGANGQLIPFDPNVLYRVTYRVRQTVNNAGSQSIYLGVVGYASDGTTLVNTSGANSSSSQHYVSAANEVLLTSAGWKVYTGYIKGRSTAGTSTPRTSPLNPGVVHNNVRYIRPIVVCNWADGAGTTQVDLVTIEVVEVGSVSGDNLQVSSVTSEKIALWAYNKNLIYDPSFEETYTIDADSTVNTYRWRYANKTGSAYVVRDERPRSGRYAARIGCVAAAEIISIKSGNFSVTPGNTYTITVNAAKELRDTASAFYVRVAGGTTDALTEYPGGTGTYLSWNGDGVENFDLPWIGQNLFTNQAMTDDDSNGIIDGGTAYSSGTVTGGSRTVSSGVQTISATSISTPGSSNFYGIYYDIPAEVSQYYKLSFNSTNSGTNTVWATYIQKVASDGSVGATTIASLSAPTGTARRSINIPSWTGVEDTIRIIWRLESTASNASSPSMAFSDIVLEKTDSSYNTNPDTPQYQTITREVTIPANIVRASVTALIYQPGIQSIFIDDVSVLEKGQGGSELTSAGLRLFNTNGDEVVALVANRANYFTVTSPNGETLASIDEEGGGSFVTTSVDGIDSDEDGTPDSGFQIYGTEYLDWLDQRGRGVLPDGYALRVDTPTSYATTTITKYLELQFMAPKGRTLRVDVPSFYLDSSIAGSSMLSYLFIEYDGTAVTTSSTQVGSTRTHAATANAYRTGGITYHMRTGDWTADREVRLLLAYSSSGSGNCKPVASSGYPIEIIITDVGPHVVDSGIDYSLASPPTTRMTYTTTWKSTGYRTWTGSGSLSYGAGTDVKQGYESVEGDCKGIWVFPSVTTALSGATVIKVEAYLYANMWYYNSGGTGLIKVHGSASLPSTVPTLTTALSSANWPKPGGRWVTLPSSLYAGFKSGTYKGIGVGPAGTTNKLYYGRFNGAGAQLRITYTK